MLAMMGNDGALTVHDLAGICKQEKWIPVLVKRPKDADNPTTLITFTTEEVARKFAKRNMPKDWLCGGVYLSPPEIEWVKEKGWEVELFDWPNKIDRSKFDIELEILEFSVQPDVFAR